MKPSKAKRFASHKPAVSVARCGRSPKKGLLMQIHVRTGRGLCDNLQRIVKTRIPASHLIEGPIL